MVAKENGIYAPDGSLYITLTDGSGNLVDPSGTTTPPGGTTGQIQYNDGGSFGGFTVSGDGTLNTSTGVLTVTQTNGVAFGDLAVNNIGGTSGQIQYNNSGVPGGLTVSGDGTLDTSTGALTVTKTNGTNFGNLAVSNYSTGLSLAGGQLTVNLTPAFYGKLTAAQTVTSGTWTKLQVGATIDTAGFWDNVNYRYLPLVPGTYFGSFSGQCNGGFTAGNQVLFSATKNGLAGSGGTVVMNVANTPPTYTGNLGTATGTFLVSMNGTTDFIELDANITATGTVTVQAATYLTLVRIGS